MEARGLKHSPGRGCPVCGTHLAFCGPIQLPTHGGCAVTKSQEVFEKVEALVAKGKTKAEAFKELAKEYGQPVDSLRGAYYTHSRRGSGPTRTRRRETTPADAIADAKAALERAIESIDREVEQAQERAAEAKAEFEALKGSAAGKKDAIRKRIEALG
jgi:phage shock protein A